MWTRTTYVPVASLAAVAIATTIALLARPPRSGLHGVPIDLYTRPPTPRPPAAPPKPAPATPEHENADLDRGQVEAALAELVGPARATLAPSLLPLTKDRHGEFDAALFDRVWALAERVHVSILDRQSRVWITFPGGERTARAIDDVLAKRWGAPSHEGDCALWIDPVRQIQMSRCIGNEFTWNEVTLEWHPYLTPRQWVAWLGDRTHAPRSKRGSGPYGPSIGAGITSASNIFVERNARVTTWHAYAPTDPEPVMRELRRKYGTPVSEVGECCKPDESGLWGEVTWRAGGERIGVEYNAYSVDVLVEVPTGTDRAAR